MRRTSFVLLALLLPFGACRPPAPPTDTIGVYRGGSVEAGEYRSWLRYRGIEDEPQRRRFEVEAMLLAKSLAARALERGLERDPRVSLSIRVGEDRRLASALRERTYAEAVAPEGEVEARFQENPRIYDTPRKLVLRHVFKRVRPATPPGEIAALREEAERLRQRALAGEDFAELARQASDSESRFRGGYLGPIAPDKLRSEAAEVVAQMKPGEVSPLVATAEGFTFVLCEQVVDAVEVPPETVRERIGAEIRSREGGAAWDRILNDLLADAAVEIDLPRVADRATPEDAVVVRYDGGEMSRGEVAARLEVMGIGTDLATLDPTSVRGAVEEAIVTEKAAARARADGLGEALVEDLAWIRRQALALASATRLIDEETPPASEADHRAHWEAHPADYVRSPQYALDGIELGRSLDRRERLLLAEDLVDAIRSGARDFASAAREHSVHESREQAGDLGWLVEERVAGMGPNILAAVKELAPGEVADPVWQDRDLWILRLREKREPLPMSYEEARPLVEADVRRRLRQEAEQRVERRLREDLELELR